MLRNQIKNNDGFVLLAGISAAVVAVVGIGGYFLHKKILKHRLHEQARRLALNFAELAELNCSDDYYDELFADFDESEGVGEDEDEYFSSKYDWEDSDQ